LDFTALGQGGTKSAANAGIRDEVFKKHDCWKSESAKDGYIEDSLSETLSVTQNLGLGLHLFLMHRVSLFTLVNMLGMGGEDMNVV